MATFSYPIDFEGTYWLILDGDIYVSSIGDDTVGTGSPQEPYATIQHAVNQAASGQKIVVGTGTYRENIDGGNKALHVVGDGLVIMNADNTGTAWTNMRRDSKLECLQIICYQRAIEGTLTNVTNCLISECVLANYEGNISHCILHKSGILATGNTNLENCTFIDTQGGPSVSNEHNFVEIVDCHFDKSSYLELHTGITTRFDYCNHLMATIQVDAVPYFSLSAMRAAHPQYQANGLAVAPAFSYPVALDYTLKIDSPLIGVGSKGHFIGAKGVSFSQNKFTLKGSTLTNITTDKANNFLLVDGFSEGCILTPIIDLRSEKVVGRIDVYGEQDFETPAFNAVIDVNNSFTHPNKITYEMRYALDQDELNQAKFTQFIWNKQPMVDEQGRGNGEDQFDLSTARSISAQWLQFKITLINSDSVITDEDGDPIAQEDGECELLLENPVAVETTRLLIDEQSLLLQESGSALLHKR